VKLRRVVDDLGTALEVYGGLAITPNLKRLAAKGTQMRSAFVSIAVCAPSRTAFLTGLRPDTTQVWTIGPYFRATSRGEGMEVVTLPQMFRMHGYNTTGSGKTHTASPTLLPLAVSQRSGGSLIHL
jgi:iduronate 2-sulfatase